VDAESVQGMYKILKILMRSLSRVFVERLEMVEEFSEIIHIGVDRVAGERFFEQQVGTISGSEVVEWKIVQFIPYFCG
jgi:hypothetical protein